MIACVYYHPQKTVVAHWDVVTLQVPTLLYYEELAANTIIQPPPQIIQTHVCINSSNSVPLQVPISETLPNEHILASEQELWFENTSSFVEILSDTTSNTLPVLLSPSVPATIPYSTVCSDIAATVKVFKEYTLQHGRSIAVGMLSGRVFTVACTKDERKVHITWQPPKLSLEMELKKIITEVECTESNSQCSILVFGDGISKAMIQSLQQQTTLPIGRLNPFFGVHSALPAEQQKLCLQRAHLLSAIVSPVLACESSVVA